MGAVAAGAQADAVEARASSPATATSAVASIKRVLTTSPWVVNRGTPRDWVPAEGGAFTYPLRGNGKTRTPARGARAQRRVCVRITVDGVRGHHVPGRP